LSPRIQTKKCNPKTQQVVKVQRLNDGEIFALKSIDQLHACHFAILQRQDQIPQSPYLSSVAHTYLLNDCFFFLKPFSKGVPLQLLASELRKEPNFETIRLFAAQLVLAIEAVHSQNFVCV